MAKKARRKLEEEEAHEAFRFPDFDERAFLAHEYEQTIATVLAVLFAVGLAAMGWALDHTGLTAAVPWILGFAGVFATPFVIRTVRPRSEEYTKGDWAWIILTTFFGWLGIWFLLLNLFPS
ncbi:MAG: hypothetical protein L3J95_01970 [Thermoplasmata archaeon]|nr:hypothetical protein [Thermoplasmata archaeon]MCI4359178.1 hypothetical protein [Thermoplasmata archaeon]